MVLNIGTNILDMLNIEGKMVIDSKVKMFVEKTLGLPFGFTFRSLIFSVTGDFNKAENSLRKILIAKNVRDQCHVRRRIDGRWSTHVQEWRTR